MCMVNFLKKSIEKHYAIYLERIADEAAKGNPDALRALEEEGGEKIKSLLAASGPAATTVAPQKSMVSMDARRRRLMRSFQYGMMSTIKTGGTPGGGAADPGPNYVAPILSFPKVNKGKPIIGKIL